HRDLPQRGCGVSMVVDGGTLEMNLGRRGRMQGDLRSGERGKLDEHPVAAQLAAHDITRPPVRAGSGKSMLIRLVPADDEDGSEEADRHREDHEDHQGDDRLHPAFWLLAQWDQGGDGLPLVEAFAPVERLDAYQAGVQQMIDLRNGVGTLLVPCEMEII